MAAYIHVPRLRSTQQASTRSSGFFTTYGSPWSLVRQSVGVIDTAGGGTIHCVCGVMALVLYIIQPIMRKLWGSPAPLQFQAHWGLTEAGAQSQGVVWEAHAT
eukprot:TRINITY_DN25350_c0_g1_i1.p3 TRINITY_DN25350_c0_g1~~TRINITY_DN25350_c0_g1_i1.p3  ORF type:complete len:103 (-),score=1.91 TRINITY_DN25350_c0_g1_i1:45-353(-)